MRIETHEPTVSSGLDIESAGGLCLEPVLLGDGSTKDEDGRAVGLRPVHRHMRVVWLRNYLDCGSKENFPK